MGDNSKIEWTDATWNPVTGCSKVGQGCKFCYAEREFPRIYPGRAFTDVRVHEDRLDYPLRWKRPRRIFVNSLSDLFHESIPDEFLTRMWAVMEAASQHIFQVLTKRPERMNMFVKSVSGAVSNIYLGVSIEDQQTADERIHLLLQTPAAVRWVSYEPALGPVDLSFVKAIGAGYVDALTGFDPEEPDVPSSTCCETLDWVVAGGESGPHARPSHPDWFRDVRDQCQAAGVPFFFKQWGMRRAGRLLDGREWNEMPRAVASDK